MHLYEFAERARQRLPELSSNDGVVLRPDSLPTVPKEMQTDALSIRRATHIYDAAWRIDRLEFYARKPTYEALGLLLLNAVLRPDIDVVDVKLTDARSEVSLLRIECEQADVEDPFGLVVRPEAFGYCETAVEKHPWVSDRLTAPWDFPSFTLTNATSDAIHEDDWKSRDVVVGFGSMQGTVRLAELLLNLSRPANETYEVELECDAGFRGVSPASAEARFWLPGGFEPDSEFPQANAESQ